MADLLNTFLGYTKTRTSPKRKFDQFYATEDTVVKRVQYLKKRGDLVTRIAFLGDDDLTSVAISVLSKRETKATVFEIDTDVIQVIKRASQRENLGIKTVECDLRNDLPKQFKGQFDVVFTDPPYTPSGISLFLNRALELLRKSYTSRIYFCYGTGAKALERELVIQEILSKKGLVVLEKIEGFNEYVGAGTIGNKSSLYVLGWTPKTRTTPVLNDRIYTNQQYSAII